jgi:hypothetical protein
MSKLKKFFFLIFFLFYISHVTAKQLSNNIVVSIDNLIITELDIKKEINFVNFINKNQIADNSGSLRNEILNILIDRKVKDIETNYYKIEISEKEIENNLNDYLQKIKINNDELNTFFNKNEIEKNYLKNTLTIELKWSKLVRQMYEGRININLTEINKQLEKEEKNIEDEEKIKKQLIIIEKNKLLNKFATTHLEKSKKKYLIKFL